jgi:hypothetical protein
MDLNETLARSADETRTEPERPDIIGVTRRADNSQPTIPEVLPILPVRRMVVFPGTVIPLTVTADSSGR